MQDFLLKLFELSVSASFLILAILVLRLFLKKAPKWISCLLWSLVGIRLVVPFSFESTLSLLPSFSFNSKGTSNYAPQITGSLPITSHIESTPSQSGVNILSILTLVWTIGILGLVIYSVISAFITSRKVIGSVRKEDNIYLCDNISSPFVMGLIRPRIYLPSDLSTRDAKCVIAHEKAHIKRLDYLTRPLGFIVLSLHWFNPFVWIAFIMFCRDVELACDERVIKEMSVKEKKNYSNALIRCSMPKMYIKASPIAFAEVNIKKRIKSVLGYKKPALWIIIFSLLVCLIVFICFMTSPSGKDPTEDNTPVDSITATTEPVETTQAVPTETKAVTTPTEPTEATTEPPTTVADEINTYSEEEYYYEDDDYYEDDYYEEEQYDVTYREIPFKPLEPHVDLYDMSDNGGVNPSDTFGIENDQALSPYDNYAFRNLGATEENDYAIQIWPH